MKALLSGSFIRDLVVTKSKDIRDTRQPGLVLRARPSGVHSYLVSLGRGKWFTLGLASVLKPDEARGLARDALSARSHGQDPIAEKRKAHGITFDQFLTEKYQPWAIANLKHGQWQVDRIACHFSPLFGNKPLTDVNGFAVEKWRADRRKGDDAVSANTTNRDITALKACLSKAVQWTMLREHPLKHVKLSKEDHGHVRYLTEAEDKRLRAALTARDDRRRSDRASANAWRRERDIRPLPEFGTYTDHLTPLVLLAVNTGLRRGELFELRWRDVDLVTKTITVRGSGAKSGRTRRVPLNAEAEAVVKAWRPDEAEAEALVFPGEDGEKLVTIKTAWLALAKTAKLTTFRFHDLRHTFASRLVQAGVDLNTVRELLGHADIGMTLRYSHLTAGNLAAAVAKIGAR